MKFTAHYYKHILHFRFEAGTSRGILKYKEVWFLILHLPDTNIFGYGECAPLAGLSVDHHPTYETQLAKLCYQLEQYSIEELISIPLISHFDLWQWPSILFGLETALLDLYSGGKQKIFQNYFSHSQSSIQINGLIWMGDEEFMWKQIEEKINKGFSCIKIKIGAIDFERELALLKKVRSTYPDIELRLDANGAFSAQEALHKLHQLAEYNIHSIEQPIKQGQWMYMKNLCKHSPIPIALDEELIGRYFYSDKRELIENLLPQYIILKPSLTGGFNASREWIEIAEKNNVGWWITSALESNIGLNAICQFTASLPITIPQGLGTGDLYYNNIPAPLKIEKGAIRYEANGAWDMSLFK